MKDKNDKTKKKNTPKTKKKPKTTKKVKDKGKFINFIYPANFEGFDLENL